MEEEEDRPAARSPCREVAGRGPSRARGLSRLCEWGGLARGARVQRALHGWGGGRGMSAGVGALAAGAPLLDREVARRGPLSRLGQWGGLARGARVQPPSSAGCDACARPALPCLLLLLVQRALTGRVWGVRSSPRISVRPRTRQSARCRRRCCRTWVWGGGGELSARWGRCGANPLARAGASGLAAGAPLLEGGRARRCLHPLFKR